MLSTIHFDSILRQRNARIIKSKPMKFRIIYRPQKTEGKDVHGLIEKSYDVWVGGTFSNRKEGVAGVTGVSVVDDSIKRFRFDSIVSMERIEGEVAA